MTDNLSIRDLFVQFAASRKEKIDDDDDVRRTFIKFVAKRYPELKPLARQVLSITYTQYLDIVGNDLANLREQYLWGCKNPHPPSLLSDQVPSRRLM